MAVGDKQFVVHEQDLPGYANANDIVDPVPVGVDARGETWTAWVLSGVRVEPTRLLVIWERTQT